MGTASFIPVNDGQHYYELDGHGQQGKIVLEGRWHQCSWN